MPAIVHGEEQIKSEKFLRWKATNPEAEAAREDCAMEFKIHTDDEFKMTSIKCC